MGRCQGTPVGRSSEIAGRGSWPRSSCWWGSSSSRQPLRRERSRRARHPGTPHRSTWRRRSTWPRGWPIGSAVVHVGDVRVEVLTPSLLRLEYSPSQHFENSPTVNALNRRMPVPPYSVSTSGGWLTVRTAERHPALQAGVGTVHPAQHLPPPVVSEAGHRRWRRRGNGSAPSGRSARPAPPPWAEAPPSARPSPGTRARRATRGSSSSREPASPGTSSGRRQARRWSRCGTTTWPARRWHRPRAPSTCS